MKSPHTLHKSKIGKRLAATLAALALTASMLVGAGLLTGCQPSAEELENTYEDNVIDIKSLQSQSGDRAITNYQVIVADAANWNTMDDTRRKALTDDAVAKCITRANEDGTNQFNIMGISESNVMLFLYDRSTEEVIVYVDGKADGTRLSGPGH